MEVNDVIRSLIREQLNEMVINDPISFETLHTASYKGQSNFTLLLKRGGNTIAHLDYSRFQGKTYIDMVEIHDDADKRKGYGRRMINHLADEFGYENIEWSSMTTDGFALRTSLDRERGFDRADHENKHFKKNEVIASIRKMSMDGAHFLSDLMKVGDQAAFKKWSDYLREHPNGFDGIDPNSLHDLSQWVRGSVTNDNHYEEEPPNHIEDIIYQMV